MQTLIKKILMFFLILSLGWFPVQVTFASSFVMPSKVMMQSNSVVQTTVQISGQTNHTMKKSMAHCDMHQYVKDCCTQKSACNQTDQDCNHCLSFVAMAHEQQQILFPPRYSLQNTSNVHLIGETSISAYRPPR